MAAAATRSPLPSTVWDRLALVYDWQLWLERPALAKAIELANLDGNDRLLDVATGTGALLRMLAQQTVRPRTVVGIERSARMLARARGLPPDWELVRADARSLPFDDASFDVVTASYLLHLLDPQELQWALAEVRRVLVPRGRLVTVTPVPPRSLLARPYAALANGAARLLPSLLAGLRPLDPCDELERSGFELQRSVFVPAGYPSLCILARRPDELTLRAAVA